MARLGGYEYWESRAATFDKDTSRIIGKATERLVDKWLLEKLRKDDVVLDLGCGTGRYTAVAADASAKVVATDLARAMLEQAQEKVGRLENVTVQKEDCCRTSFGDNTFDAVLMGNLLHIIPEPTAAAAEAFRVLRGGGRLLAVDYTNKGMTFWRQVQMMIRILRAWGVPSTDNRVLGAKTSTRIAEAAGFEVRSSDLIGLSTKAVCLHAVKPSP